ncbi:MAG: site-specific DNA-methyltransferase [Sulfurovum sp.]
MQNNTISKNRQAFYSQLEQMFAGRELENFKGKSGFSNLLSIKSEYFKHIKKELETKIKDLFNTTNSENELYTKAFTFFDSFLNETGSPYFNKTEFYKNLYEKVYTNSSDTALFYKTSKLYYVKSDSVPSNADYQIKNENEESSRAKIIFEVSDDLNYSSTNEKKELKFLLKDLSKGEKSITLLVLYKGQKVDLGDDFSFELNAKISDKKYELLSSNKTNLKKFDELLTNYALDITPSEVSQAIYTYKKQREIDFFIHKDSANFLKEQFNLYMYNYLFNDDEIQFNDWDIERLQQIKNIKETIFETIELISKFEDELRAMWLKPKFVKNLNYIITLDKIDSSLHDEIFAIKEQVTEWEELGLTEDNTLIKNEFLPVDTKYLSDKLKYKILSSFDNLDEITDGVLIKSDNFQALNTILPKYKEKVKCIYIDPPYNTGSDGFIYKDNFNHSSWMTMMENRLSLAKKLMSDDGVIFESINDKEQANLKLLNDSVFGEDNFISSIVWNQKNVVQNDAKFISTNHEYILSFRKSDKVNEFKLLPRSDEMDARYSNPDNDIKGNWTSVALQAKSGSDSNLYDITFPNGVHWQPVKGTYPRLSKDSLMKAYYESRLWFGKNGTNVPRLKKYLSEVKQGVVSNSIWKNEDVGSTQFGKENLKNILNTNTFQTPKPYGLIERAITLSSDTNSIILDFFAGSGTTGHAVINLNRKNKTTKKYILIEMGGYFDEILIPRIKKVICSDKYKMGVAQNNNGISQIVKYYELETYEDVLSKAHYSLSKDGLIDLYQSEKLARDDVVDKNKDNVKLDIDAIYNDIDIYETISNITGFKIKKRYEDSCLFMDGDKEVLIRKDELLFSKYPFLRKLIWWKS